MAGRLLILASVFVLQISLALKNLDEPRYKSFRDAELECAEYLFITNETLQRYQSNGYPNEPSDAKLLNCVLVDLNAWDEDQQQVKDYVLSQYFVPSTTDCQYEQHTKECLDQNVAPLNQSDRLGRVYQSFQCYYQNYAGLDEDDVNWVPYDHATVLQTLSDCMRIEDLSPQSLLDLCQGRIVEDPDYPALAYCFFTRTGIYNRTTGFDLEKLYIQFGSKALLSDSTKECVARVAAQYCKEPERIGEILKQCLIQYLPAAQDIGTAASNVLGNPPECVVPPTPAPKTQPCYNPPCD